MTVVFAAFIFLLSCDSNRPESKGEFNYSLKVSSIQILADVEIKEGDEVIQSGVTDESGNVVFSDVKALTDLTVKICGGTVKLISSTEPVAWTGCMEASFKPADVDEISVTVDILSTFISKYDSETRIEEFQEYLNITTLPAPALQTSLTDATKRYLWYQGIAKVAENVSKANAVTPETMYSTENLLNLLYADLVDDKIINGSTKAKFGSLTIEASILKNILADAIPSVDKAFSATDLKSWTDKIRNSEAKFLGGEGSGTDSEKPVIEIISPAGENATVFGTVGVEAAATDNKEITSLNCSITGEDMPELTDSVEDPASFKAEFDSTSITDGKITIKCIASDGTNLSEKEISVTISNSNTAGLTAFITNELTLWDSVTVYNLAGTKIQTVSFVEDEETKTVLAPGIYRFVFKGGAYKPVFLADDTIEFDGTLETRGEVKAGETTNIIATPLTTLREYLYRALTEKSDAEAEVKSLTLISEHIDSDFPLYIEPVSKNQLTENSKYYIVLAALERLAVLVGERHDPALEAGAITIEQVLKALTDDLEADSKAILDGGASINQFPVDSYLFRYWYAIALKLFLESEENLTGLKFSDLQTVISNISMDESELFPEAEKAKKVTDQPPVISEKQFKRFFETEYQNYSVENIIYANDSVFSLKFKALPDDSGDLTIDLVELFGDIEVQSLSDINEAGDYTAEIKFKVVADGEKSIGIRAVDNAENTGTATLQAIKDTIQPLIVNLGNTLPANVTTPLTVSYAVTEINPLDSLYAVTPAGEAATVWTSLNPAVLTGDITVTDDMLTDDGAYTLHFKSVDKAGNEKVQTKTLSFDRIIPTAVFTTIPEINENGFIAQNSIAITIIATDNLTGETELIHEFFDGVSWVENTEAVKNVWNMQNLQQQLYETKYRVKDLAGNKSADINVSFSVDTVFPVLTTNKTALQGRAYRIDDTDLKIISTCSETNLLTYTYSINGGDAVDIIYQSTPLINNESLTEGLNSILVKCIDKAGNVTEETINLIIDNTPPVVSVVTSPAEGSTICAFSQNIAVKGTDELSKPVKAKYSYSVNGLTVSSTYEVILNDSGEGTLLFPNSADAFYSDTAKYGNLLNPVVFSISMIDEAGNESFPYCLNWNFDREPPKYSFYMVNENFFAVINPDNPMINGSEIPSENFSTWINQKAAEAGLSDISSLKSYKDGILSKTFTVVEDINSAGEGECADFLCGGENDKFHICRVCFHPAEFPSIFDFKAVFIDSCGNTGVITNCKTDDYYCIQKSINLAYPPLSVTTYFSTTDNLVINIQSEGAVVQTCKVYKSGTFVENCDSIQGPQSLSTASYSEETYEVRVTSKFSAGSNITTKSSEFVVDRTPFSISVNLNNGKDFYLKQNPSLSYFINIASGVKSVKLYLQDRTINYRYTSAGYTCDSNGQCLNGSYNKLVYANSAASGTFSLSFSGVYAVIGGIYSKVKYEVVPNWGATKTGFVSITPIKLISKDAEDMTVWHESSKIRFKESIISKKLTTGRFKIAGNTHYSTMCKINDNVFYKKRDVVTSPGHTLLIDAAATYGTLAFTKGKSVYYWFREGKIEGAYSNDGSCEDKNDCPPYTTEKCIDEILDDGMECVASRNVSDHWSDSGSFPWYGNSCNCNNMTGNEQCLKYNCQYLADFEYYPSSIYFVITENSPRPAVTKYAKDFFTTNKKEDCIEPLEH